MNLTEHSEAATGKRYLWRMMLAGVIYVAVLAVSITLLKTRPFTPALRDLIAVTPAVPMVAALWAILRFVQSVDELQRQIHLEALAISAGVTCALAMTYTFLEGVGFPHSQAWWAFDVLILGWGLALPFVRKRYE